MALTAPPGQFRNGKPYLYSPPAQHSKAKPGKLPSISGTLSYGKPYVVDENSIKVVRQQLQGFNLQRIPEVMDRKGWVIGAKLMREWFAGPSNNKPEKGRPNTKLVTMDWVLSYFRARQALYQMVLDKVWKNDAACGQILQLLDRNGLLVKRNAAFDYIRIPQPKWDAHSINYRRVGSLKDPIDDLFAALGKFLIKVLVRGEVETGINSGFKLTIHEVGFYVRDSYDFNQGTEPLGCWNLETDYVGGDLTQGKLITNADFREWRNQNGHGEDRLIYSADYKTIRLNPPDIVKL